MKYTYVSFLSVILWSHTLYSQDKSVFFPEYPWVTLEESKSLPTDSVLYLDLSSSKLDSLPQEVFQYKNLRALSLKGLKLEHVDNDLGKLTSLLFLDLSKNRLKDVPPSISQLKNLETLVISRNTLSMLPDFMGKLKHLHYLDLWSTEIIELPLAMDKLKELKYIDMRGINLSPVTQENLHRRFPLVKIELDPPCNCFR